eukprot:Rhum_TRINITY_DN4630_c0_g1::Rhum_TRINITY_DN4630_c0_g1_i1::g.15144::m.15144
MLPQMWTIVAVVALAVGDQSAACREGNCSGYTTEDAHSRLRTGAVLVDVAMERDRTWQGRGPPALARVAASIERSLAADGARFSADGTPSASLRLLLRLELEALDAGAAAAATPPVAVYYLEADTGDFVSLRRPLPCEVQNVSLCAVPRWSPEAGVDGTRLASDAAVMVRRVAADEWGGRQAAYAVQADGGVRRLYAYPAKDERGGKWYVESLRRNTFQPRALTTYNGTRASALHMVTGRRTAGASVSRLGVLGADYPLNVDEYLSSIPIADATTTLLVLRARGRVVLATSKSGAALPVTGAVAVAARDAVFEQVPRLTSGPGVGSGTFSAGGVAHAFDAVGVDGGGWDSDFVLVAVWIDDGAARYGALCAADAACRAAWGAAARAGRELTALGVRSSVAAEVAAAEDAVDALDADRRAGLLVTDGAACAGGDACRGVAWAARGSLRVALKGAAEVRPGLARVEYAFAAEAPAGARVCGFVRVADGGPPPLQVWESCEDGAAGPPECAGGVALFQGDDASAPVGEVHAGHRVEEEEWFKVGVAQTTSKVVWTKPSLLKGVGQGVSAVKRAFVGGGTAATAASAAAGVWGAVLSRATLENTLSAALVADGRGDDSVARTAVVVDADGWLLAAATGTHNASDPTANSTDPDVNAEPPTLAAEAVARPVVAAAAAAVAAAPADAWEATGTATVLALELAVPAALAVEAVRLRQQQAADETAAVLPDWTVIVVTGSGPAYPPGLEATASPPTQLPAAPADHSFPVWGIAVVCGFGVVFLAFVSALCMCYVRHDRSVVDDTMVADAGDVADEQELGHRGGGHAVGGPTGVVAR